MATRQFKCIQVRRALEAGGRRRKIRTDSGQGGRVAGRKGIVGVDFA